MLGSASATIEVKVRFLHLATRQDWQEGQERDVCVPPCALESIAAQPLRQRFTFESAEDAEGRSSETLDGKLELRASRLDESLFRVTLIIRNLATSGKCERT